MTLVMDRFELFGNAGIDPHAWEKVPRRNKEKMEEMVQEVIGRLPRIPLSNLDEDDRVCYICHEEYGSTVTVSNDVFRKEEPVRLNCGHRLGSTCIAEWILSAPEAGCPVCRKPVVRSKLLSRVEDIKQYLLWYIRKSGARRGAHMLVTMECFRYDLMKEDISRAVSEQDEEKLARLRVDLEAYKAQMRRRCSPHYIEQYNTKGMKVAASEGLSPEQWIMWSMTRTAATCIRYHMPDDVLKTLACRYITDEVLDGYKLDEHYGPNGVSDNYSWVPDIWDKRFEPYDVSRTGVRIDQWSFDFPILITGDWNPNSGRGLHWADMAYKED